MSRDLESAVLVKKPEAVDPLEHPWLFLAESSGRGAGADRLKFQARNHRPRAALGHESDLVVIAYWLAPAEDGDTLELLRWTSPQLPESLDRSFPRRDDPGVEVLASHVGAFGVRLQDQAGAWADSWDSSTLVHSSELPVAAEVSVALLPEEPPADEFAEEPPAVYQRPVLLPLRPLDLEKTLEGEAEGEDQEQEDDDLACVTVSECLSRNPELVDQLKAQNPEIEGILESIGSQCAKDQSFPVPENCQ
jgi:hypothetical protein